MHIGVVGQSISGVNWQGWCSRVISIWGKLAGGSVIGKSPSGVN